MLTKRITYGDLKDGDVIMLHGIPMVVSKLEKYMIAHNPTVDKTPKLTVRFTGTFDETKYAWARGYSGGTYGAYAWVPCEVMVSKEGPAQALDSRSDNVVAVGTHDTVEEIACPRCGGYPASRPSCPLCRGTGKATRNLGRLVGESIGHSLYFLGASYNCPSLKLFGYSSERALRNAVTRKVKAARLKAGKASDGPGPSRLSR